MMFQYVLKKLIYYKSIYNNYIQNLVPHMTIITFHMLVIGRSAVVSLLNLVSFPNVGSCLGVSLNPTA